VPAQVTGTAADDVPTRRLQNRSRALFRRDGVQCGVDFFGPCRETCRVWSNRRTALGEEAAACFEYAGQHQRTNLNAALGQHLPLLGWCQAQMMLRRQIAARDACIQVRGLLLTIFQ